MASRLKTVFLYITTICLVCSCVKESNDYRDNATYPGYVAMDYTGNVIRSYTSILTKIYQFNEYISQTTIEKRDSVDRLYFEDIKIIRDEKDDIWILRDIYFNGYSYMSINTNGKVIDDDNAKWIISFYNRNYADTSEAPEFEIEKTGDRRWHIKKHTNNDYVFDYSSEWDIRLSPSGDVISLEGSGSLLSVESPKLKLEYTITTPVDASYNYYFVSMYSGAFTILATDVDKDITEETKVDIISEYELRITYKDKTESYNYSL